MRLVLGNHYVRLGPSLWRKLVTGQVKLRTRVRDWADPSPSYADRLAKLDFQRVVSTMDQKELAKFFGHSVTTVGSA